MSVSNFSKLLSEINFQNSYYEVAVAYLQQQFIVIPISSNKVATESWKVFQVQRPTVAMLYHWFIECAYPALAIVCGSLSRLIILDFDTEEQFRRFQYEHPKLVATFMVRTRRGYHLWYRIPENMRVSSRRGDGIDLLAEGKYAVAPPSAIDGYTYLIEQALPILEITPDDIRRIEAFVAGDIVEPEGGQGEAALPMSLAEVRAKYRRYAHVGNRNTALFDATKAARDAGWSLLEVIELLTYEYVASGLKHENPDKRKREAINTIKSAFSRPPGRVYAAIPLTLPNTIKEALFKQGLTCIVRLLEALFQHGYRPGDIIHPQVLRQLLKGIVGWHSIHKALKATLGNGLCLFKPIFEYEMVSPRTPSSEASAIPVSTDNTKMLLSENENRKKPHKGGRPKLRYRIPEFSELFRAFDLKPSRARDVLPLEAVRSAKATRKAMEELLIRRSPGNYGRQLLADRVGVSLSTIDTYHKEFAATYPDFNKRHCYFETQLHWKNLDLIPPEDMLHNGIFLIDDTGKRYPAKKPIALMLLKRKRKVSLMRQTFNEYWFGSRFSPPSLIGQPQKVEAASEMHPEMWREKAALYFAGLSDALEAHNRAKTTISVDLATHREDGSSEGITTPVAPKKVTKAKERPPHDPRRKFPYTEDEELVERLQQRINKLCKKPGQAISKKTLRWLMVTYGKSVVKAAVKRVERLDYVDDNPVGFLIVMLRSDSKNGELKAMLDNLKRTGSYS